MNAERWTAAPDCSYMQAAAAAVYDGDGRKLATIWRRPLCALCHDAAAVLTAERKRTDEIAALMAAAPAMRDALRAMIEHRRRHQLALDVAPYTACVAAIAGLP